uniref:Uncharacterized protein n=1 Tax=Oryza punctata TaxID=4537 RepID=A0A0E0MFE9_ORYPU
MSSSSSLEAISGSARVGGGEAVGSMREVKGASDPSLPSPLLPPEPEPPTLVYRSWSPSQARRR